MHKFFLAVLIALTSSLVAVSGINASQMASPEGVWELEYRDSHFDVAFCDGDKLCVTLIWLSEGASTPEKTVYLNTMLIDHATRVDDISWKGGMNLFGHEAKGEVTQINDDLMHLRGCVFEVLCQTFEFYRIK